MAERAAPTPHYRPPPLAFGRTDGVLRRRFVAYLLDFVFITILAGLLGALLAVASVLSLGLTLPLFAVLWPAAAILYSAFGVGGSGMGTIGMRMTGVAVVDATTGGPVGIGVAGVHALMFYVGIGTLLLLVLDLAIGLVRSDRRLGHDLLAGLVLVRR